MIGWVDDPKSVLAFLISEGMEAGIDIPIDIGIGDGTCLSIH